MACLTLDAEPKFKTCDLTSAGSTWMFVDLDGDGLKDLILTDNTHLSIFYQDKTEGFAGAPQQTYQLDSRPCVFWAAKLGGPAESLLVMNSDGVSQIEFTNRSASPTVRQIIRQKTMIPAFSAVTNPIPLSLTAETGGTWPLILVPAADGIHVWQHRGDWREAQVIGNSINAVQGPARADSKYSSTLALDLTVADVNGDGRDDLIVRRKQADRTNIYNIYLQQPNGVFAAEPDVIYSDDYEPYSWTCWIDLNKDGKVDLVKGRWLNESSFVPGLPSPKVVVWTYIADAQGRIPAKPTQTFRKNDWSAVLPIVDVDGDGYPDLTLGFSHMNTKEDATREITAKEISFDLRFYFYRPGTGYPTEADLRRNLTIRVSPTEIFQDIGPQMDIERYANLRGDFNGDGKADLLVRDRAGEISVYFFLSREKGFSVKPDLRLSCPDPIDEWEIADLNNDGVSDLLVKLAKKDAWRIFLSRN